MGGSGNLAREPIALAARARLNHFRATVVAALREVPGPLRHPRAGGGQECPPLYHRGRRGRGRGRAPVPGLRQRDVPRLGGQLGGLPFRGD
eukprot:3125458-Alexandrium_andersonii.AAC.1